jgi:site-specific DNA recombinase
VKKKAIGYKRISTKDQSNFSLDGQDKYISEFAEKNNYDIVEIFTDDGKSAKSFDRPDWIKLERFIEKNKDVQFLIVAKYDRFSRNTAEGLHKIELLEKKYGIIIISVFEQMFIDYNSPFFFKQRADILVNAEFELRVIRDRTRFGIHQAKQSGRYVHKAPFGYVNRQDESKKPIIEISEPQAAIVRNIFNQYVQGVSLSEIGKEARGLGFTLKGRSAVFRVLSNCVYAGMIYVAPYRDEPAKHVKALHPPIIDQHTWTEAQYKLGNIKQPKNIMNEEVPLRGVLKCHCGACLTAGRSKGKLRHYWYYKCSQHPKENLSAGRLHKQFNEILDGLSLTPDHIDYLLEAAQREMKTQMSERTDTLKAKKKELEEAKTTLDNLEQKYIEDRVNEQTYSKWFPVYHRTVTNLKAQVNNLQGSTDDKYKVLESNLYRLKDMKWLFSNATLLQKHLFIKMVFNSGLYYSAGVYRTPEILPIFDVKPLTANENSPLIIDQEAVKIGLNPVSSPDESIIEHVHSFLSLVADIKAA